MTNRYLEKIAAFTGIEASIAGAVGAKKGDRIGGAVSGIGGAMVGGTAVNLGSAALRSVNTGRSMKDIIHSFHAQGRPLSGRVPLTVGMAGGAYLAGKAYSALKHRND